MGQANYRARLREYIRANAHPPEKFSHQARLYVLARQLGQEEACPFDDDVLFAAAWLHDLGVFIGHRPQDLEALARWDHIGYALAQAPRILRQFEFPEDRIAAVCEAIRTHLPTGTPTSFEGSLLREADILEQLGAVGILRTVSKIGRDTRFRLFSDALLGLRKNLQELPSRLTLASAQRLAQRRIMVLREFLEAAEKESEGVEW